MSLLWSDAFRYSYFLCKLCSTVRMSAVTSHLLLLDKVVGRVSQLSCGSVSYDLWHRCKVASLCVLFKIDSLVGHPVRSLFPAQYVIMKPTRGALAAHSRSFEMPIGVELCRFRALSFCLGFDCGMGWMNLSLLVKAWELLRLQTEMGKIIICR